MNDVVPAQRIGRLERLAILGVLMREMINYSSFWRSSAFSSTMEPTIYLLAFGFGVGSLVNRVGTFSYVEYVATATVATGCVFSSAFPSMFSTFVKYKFQRTYDAILAAPVDAEELVTAEVLWIAARAGVYGCAPLLVAMLFGLDPAWGMLTIPLICFLTGLGWACFGVTISATMNSIDNFSYIISGVMTPMMLFGGTFFPLSQLPDWARAIAEVNPVHHCVELVRHAVFGFQAQDDFGHVLFLACFAGVLWRLAIRQMGRRLVD
jgi:lipooligosaccharide transport system permease protein